MQLKAQQSIWSSHCGIVSLNPQIHITSLYVSSDDRVILCKVSHPNNVFPSFTIMNIYAPAIYHQRYAFYANLLCSEYFQVLLTNMTTDNPLASAHPDIIVGDFNYNFTQFPSHTIPDYSPSSLEFLSSAYASQDPIEASPDPDSQFVLPQLDQHPTPLVRSQWIWHGVLLHHYREVSHKLQTDPPIPTFRRESTSTTIDYMFISPDLAPLVRNSDIQFISSTWTDHALLRIDLQFTSNNHGTGIWKANPNLAQNDYFITQLHLALDELHANLASHTEPPPVQISWDEIKRLTISLAKKISRHKACWRTRHLKQFQRKRNKLIKSYRGQTAIATQILKVERLINNLQEELVEVAALRSGLRWREQGEKSAGLMKRLTTQRTNRRSIDTLYHPDTNELCTQPDDLQAAAQRYYEILYTPAPVDHSNISYFTNQIPPSDRLSNNTHVPLCAPFTPEDLSDGAFRSPNKSSPGIDGLPYEVLSILFQHPATLKMALQVYNKALSSGIFPPSWQQTCLILLPKKGDLSLLKNWRPISLINTDAKIFTRLINHRLMTHLGSKLSTTQMGFMPQRFIGEQGLIVQCMQEIATKTGSTTIALLLDQEKAYDRVHLDYLRACMEAFNIPPTLTTAITSLFSSTTSAVNVNGFLSPSFQQGRGLRQGDPLSPLLFNIAFDPLLRAINNHNNITGFHLPLETNQSMTMPSPPPIKVLAYADDTLVVLRNPTEFEHLQDIINQYMAASNASLNYSKTQALSLSGKPHPLWISFLQDQGITSWHDRTSSEPLTYLGFAICSSANQRAIYAHSIISKLRAYCQLHSTRSLTYRARVTVINALLYSKLWHVMRLFTFSSPELKQLQQLAATFINRGSKISRLAFEHLTQPINQGGLKLLDPATQANALQWRWLYFLIHPPQASPSLMPSIPILRYTLNFVLSTAEYPSYHWSFLFPHCRPVIPRLFGPIVNLLRAVDSIPHNYHFSHATMSTCLHLPLMELLVHNLPPTHPIAHLFQPPHNVLKNQPTIRQLKGSDIFIFNPNRLCLEYNHLPPALPHGPSINKTISLLCSNQLLLNNFVLYNFLPNVPRPHNALEVHNLPNSNIPTFSALHSFVTNLLIPPEPNYIRPTTKASSIKYFKCLLTSSSPPSPSSILSSTQWRQFWKLEIALNARNTWYRILLNKITTKELLHLRMSDKFAPQCTICPSRTTNIETTAHFLFSCPIKYTVWSQALSTYIDPDLQSPTYEQFQELLHLRSSLTVSTSSPYPTLTTYQVFSCILQAIWSCHYRSIFDSFHFEPLQVLLCIDRALYTLASQDNVHSLL